MFITIEDETGIANLVVWPAVFEKQRRIILSASMISAYGRIQRAGEVVHLVVHRLRDLSGALASVGMRARLAAPAASPVFDAPSTRTLKEPLIRSAPQVGAWRDS